MGAPFVRTTPSIPGETITERYDVAVVGLGAVGSAAAAALAGRGYRVVGIDRWSPPHAMGSSHSATRMIREAYYQGALYLPLVREAYESWRELEAETGRPLLRVTRGLMIGRPESRVFGGCLRTARDHGLEHEVLGPEEVRKRFPPFRLEAGTRAVLEPNAGVLALEACMAALLERARGGGAELRTGERVTAWTDERDGVTIRTEAAEHRARRAVFALGAWTGAMMPELGLPIEVERTVQHWVEPAVPGIAPDFEPDRCPPWVWEYEPHRTWYGFPDMGRGIKTGMHVEGGRLTDPDAVRREVGKHEWQDMRAVLGRFMPGAAGRAREASVCLYANTPDENFLLGRHPDRPRVVLFGGGSGHAFKFAPVLGRLLADLATDRDPGFDLAPFRLDRF
ncbi:MAG: N-methyl-L-tryptophan oxidase [Gemmatimonadota bacterium]|nr:N-methyl-L-tryptophan oxidase [Gemmatimonadota bacterium]